MPESKSHFATTKQRKERQVPKARPAASSWLKGRWRRSGSKLSLKRFVDRILDLVPPGDASEARIRAESWAFNKATNFRKAQLCVGRTRGRVKKNRGSAQVRNLSGK